MPRNSRKKPPKIARKLPKTRKKIQQQNLPLPDKAMKEKK